MEASVAPLSAPAAAAEEQRPASPSSLLDPLTVTRSLELSLRDRNSQMLAAGGADGKGFSAVLEQADKAAAAEKAARARRASGGTASGAPSSSRPTPHGGSSGGSTLGPIAALPSRRFERDRAPGAVAGGAAPVAGGAAPLEGLEGLEDMGIQLYGARAAKAAEAEQAEAAAAAAAEERRRGAEEAARRSAAASGAKRKAGAPSSSGKAAPAAAEAGVSKGLPIIVVPPSATSRLNMMNAPSFFSIGSFEHPDALRAAGAKKSSAVEIVREVAREGGETGGSSSQQGGAPPASSSGGAAGAGAAAGASGEGTRYFITDNTAAFRSIDWSRVVAVVVSGAAWQFKGWPFKGLAEGHTVDLFSKVAGVFVGYADEDPPAAVKSWNVTRYALHREARHRDRSVASAVWRAIDAMRESRRARALG